jgi:hypothetical protein
VAPSLGLKTIGVKPYGQIAELVVATDGSCVTKIYNWQVLSPSMVPEMQLRVL